jgi:hypothetical protein
VQDVVLKHATGGDLDDLDIYIGAARGSSPSVAIPPLVVEGQAAAP